MDRSATAKLQSSPPRRTRNRRALLVAYQFPPTGGSGVQRVAKLAKYLPSHGWDVEIITAAHQRFPWHDATLLQDLPERCRVHRVAGSEPACVAARLSWPMSPLPRCRTWLEDRIYWRLSHITQRFGIGNGESLWVNAAVRAALRLNREQEFDCIVSSGPPHFVHAAALRISAQTRLPWIADVRDPLVSDFERASLANGASTSAGRLLEQQIFRHASIVITTSPSLSKALLARYPQSTVQTITNGFDADDVRLWTTAAQRGNAQECVFVAAGSFYGRREIARLVEPLDRVLRENPDWRGKVRLVIAGSIDTEQRRYWEQHRPEWLEFRGYLEHSAAVELAANATCNIVIVPDCEHGRTSIPGKTFELLPLPAHILGLVPPGSDTARVLSGAGAATLATFEDRDVVADAMRRIIEGSFTGQLAACRTASAIAEYDRRALAHEFADCMGMVCEQPAHHPASTLQESSFDASGFTEVAS